MNKLKIFLLSAFLILVGCNRYQVPMVANYQQIPVIHVQKNDTLYALAKRYDTTAEELAKHNGIDDPTELQPGQSLNVPRTKSAEARARRTSAPQKAQSASASTKTASTSAKTSAKAQSAKAAPAQTATSKKTAAKAKTAATDKTIAKKNGENRNGSKNNKTSRAANQKA